MSDTESRRILYLDLELTCWEGGTPPPGQWSEIIQVGIVEVNTRTLSLTRSHNYFVKPCYSKVSAYCTELTGITQETVDRYGRPLVEVKRSILKQFGTSNKLVVAWGNDDRVIDFGNCVSGEVRVCDRFLNLGHLFKLTYGLTANTSLYAAMAMLGVEPTGRQHDALDDATNLARLHIRMLEQARTSLPATLIAQVNRVTVVNSHKGCRMIHIGHLYR
jgi:inhibitor of KinA sporulation pathway (predicted exonuclease)